MNHDIHLKQGRGMSESAFMILYGVSETWLSLLSQTTRLANLIRALNHGSKEKTLTLHEHIERRKDHFNTEFFLLLPPSPLLIFPSISTTYQMHHHEKASAPHALI